MSVSFGISWIYEEFHAVRMNHGKCLKDWRSPTPVTNLHEFSEALNAACRALDMRRGGDVAIAYESDEHTHTFLDLPPMSERDMEKYLNRRVEQEKQFEESPAWSFRCSSGPTQGTESGSGQGHGKSVLLHVMPASIRNAIMRICEENYVIPRRLLPLTDVMAQHVHCSDNGASENALLIALFDSRIEMVVLNDRGDPLFVRELGFHWNGGEMERLRTDVERTMLFAKQRLSSTVKVVSLMGVDAIEAARQLQPYFNIELQPDEQSIEASFWAAEVNRLPKRTKTNFIPRSMQRAITSRQLKNTSKRMAFTASLAAAVVMLSVEYFVFLYANDEHTVDSRIGDLEIRYHQLMSEADELDQLEHRLQVLTGPEYAFPIVLMERLGDLLPASMVVNRVHVQKQAVGWSFQMSGTNQTNLADSAESLALLEQRLNEGPWYATVSSTWQDTWLQQLRAGKAISHDLINFQLDGHLQ